ncbi:gas vesicle protein [Rhodococcus koreensis]
MTVVGGGTGNLPQSAGGGFGGGHQSTNLGEILERVLDKGLVIAGDIQVNLLDIELLTIKVRLVIASLETAKEVGIDWWEHDPWLTGKNSDIELENRRLRERIAELESDRSVRPAVEAADTVEVEARRQERDDDRE